MSTPRIQFRLSKSDQDLLEVFEGAENTTDIAKRYIRLGMAYEKLKEGRVIVYHPKNSKVVVPESYKNNVYTYQTN